MIWRRNNTTESWAEYRSYSSLFVKWHWLLCLNLLEIEYSPTCPEKVGGGMEMVPDEKNVTFVIDLTFVYCLWQT